MYHSGDIFWLARLQSRGQALTQHLRGLSSLAGGTGLETVERRDVDLSQHCVNLAGTALVR